MAGFGTLGDTYFASYRDPNLRQTNEVFDGIADYVRNFTATERDMTKYIIGAVSELDTPLTPMMKGIRSRNAAINGRTFEDYQRERNEILGANQESIRALADLMEAVLSQDNLCVIGNEKKLEEEKEMFGELVPFVE